MSRTLQENKDFAFQKGTAFTFPVDLVDPTGADDYFWHVINNGGDPIEITGVSFTSTVAGFMQIDRVTGTAGGGQTAIAQLNRRSGDFAAVENVICSTDPDITGLTIVAPEEVVGVGTVLGVLKVPFENPIRINRGQQVAGLWSAATGILTGVVHWRKITWTEES